MNRAASTSTLPAPAATRLVWRPIDEGDLAVLAEVAKTAHAHPWTLRHFADSLTAGHWARLLALQPCPDADPPHWVHAPQTGDGHWLLGFLVAMPGVDEGHLLDLTVTPLHQRQGWGRWMLQALRDWGLAQGYGRLWLEVRRSNTRARTLYERCGWRTVGVRKGYYPDTAHQREDALVMRLDLDAAAAA